MIIMAYTIGIRYWDCGYIPFGLCNSLVFKDRCSDSARGYECIASNTRTCTPARGSMDLWRRFCIILAILVYLVGV